MKLNLVFFPILGLIFGAHFSQFTKWATLKSKYSRILMLLLRLMAKLLNHLIIYYEHEPGLSPFVFKQGKDKTVI